MLMEENNLHDMLAAVIEHFSKNKELVRLFLKAKAN